MAEIDAHAIVTIVPPDGDEEAAIAKTEADLDEALAEDEQAAE
jgi:hypothetical protein